MDEVFNSTYYATAAQVIPIFFLSVLAERFFVQRGDDRGRSLILLSLILVTVWGEALALDALEYEREPSTPGRAVIVLAYVLPLFLIAADLVSGPLWNILRGWPRDRLRIGSVVIGVLAMGAGIASLAGVNIQPVSTWIILAFVLVPLVYGFVTASGARKSDAD